MKSFHQQTDARESDWMAEQFQKCFGPLACLRSILLDLSLVLPSESLCAALAWRKWKDHQYAPWRSTLGRQWAAEKQCVLKKGVY